MARGKRKVTTEALDKKIGFRFYDLDNEIKTRLGITLISVQPERYRNFRQGKK